MLCPAIKEAPLPDMRAISANFEEAVLPHLDAAYNLARWLMGNDHDAQDAVQEAYLRAWRFFDGMRRENPRAWLLTIVRNVCSTSRAERRARPAEPLEERSSDVSSPQPGPDARLLKEVETQTLRAALERMPTVFREVIVLHELEGLSYKQVSEVTRVPVGTVMSRLSRARDRLQRALAPRPGQET